MDAGPGIVLEKIVRQRIHDSLYWKQHCFALNAASFVDRASDLTAVGGMYANQRPTAFLSLVYKLILMQPDREIIEEYLNQPYFKYLTAAAALYARLVYKPADVYTLIEPLLADYRKLRWQTTNTIELWHMDEYADALLNDERIFGLQMPRLTSRVQLEDMGLSNRELLVSEPESETEDL